MPRVKPSQIRDMLTEVLNGKVTDPEVSSLLSSFGAQSGVATYMEVFVRQLIIRACLGDARAISEVMDRLIGKQNPNAKDGEDDSATYNDFLMAVVEIEEKRRLGVQVENDPMKVLERQKTNPPTRGHSEGESESSRPIVTTPPASKKEKPRIFEDLL